MYILVNFLSFINAAIQTIYSNLLPCLREVSCFPCKAVVILASEHCIKMSSGLEGALLPVG